MVAARLPPKLKPTDAVVVAAVLVVFGVPNNPKPGADVAVVAAAAGAAPPSLNADAAVGVAPKENPPAAGVEDAPPKAEPVLAGVAPRLNVLGVVPSPEVFVKFVAADVPPIVKPVLCGVAAGAAPKPPKVGKGVEVCGAPKPKGFVGAALASPAPKFAPKVKPPVGFESVLLNQNIIIELHG